VVCAGKLKTRDEKKGGVLDWSRRAVPSPRQKVGRAGFGAGRGFQRFLRGGMSMLMVCLYGAKG